MTSFVAGGYLTLVGQALTTCWPTPSAVHLQSLCEKGGGLIADFNELDRRKRDAEDRVLLNNLNQLHDDMVHRFDRVDENFKDVHRRIDAMMVSQAATQSQVATLDEQNSGFSDSIKEMGRRVAKIEKVGMMVAGGGGTIGFLWTIREQIGKLFKSMGL